MRIAFVTFEYPPLTIGGAGEYAKNVSKELARVGHQVSVFAPSSSGRSKEEYDIERLQILDVKVSNQLPLRAMQFWVRLPKTFAAAEKEAKFDIVHFNGLSYWFLRRLAEAPHVVTIHHLVKDAIASNDVGLISRLSGVRGENGPLTQLVEERAIRLAERFIVQNEYTKQRISKAYGVGPDRIDVVPSAHQISDLLMSKENGGKIRQTLDIGNRKLLLFVGRVNDPRKNLASLMRAFKHVLEKANVALLVVGKGDKKKMIQLAEFLGIPQDSIIFTGYVDPATLRQCYHAADIYVCPSRLEGFGLTIAEAMAAGKPIVATNAGAIPEIVQDQENGTLVSPNEPAQMAEAILSLLDNPELRLRMGSTNRRKASEVFNWGISIGLMTKAYEKAIEQYSWQQKE